MCKVFREDIRNTSGTFMHVFEFSGKTECGDKVRGMASDISYSYVIHGSKFCSVCQQEITLEVSPVKNEQEG